MTQVRMESFSITGPLPSGTSLIEASAGTGKTWTVAALVVRYVAEGVATLDQLLIVTFSRAASQELRERVRTRLEETVLALESGAGDEDPLVVHLRDCSEPELQTRLTRLRHALTDFDTATIATIHQFCHYVLKGLGVAGDSDPNAQLAEDLDQLRDDVVDDLYLAGTLAGDPDAPDYKMAIEDAKIALDNPDAEVIPRDATGKVGRRVDYVKAVREEFARRKLRASVMSYDDLLEQLAAALEADDSPARQRMRDRWSIVLVDEFQDTDPVQWQVFSRAFSGNGKTLILIGDPKQAIYGFRGGDINTYLSAADTATQRTSLPTNYRSDAPLVDALQVLMAGVELSEGIVAHPISAHQQGHRLQGAPDNSPVRLRTYPENDEGRQPYIGQARNAIYPDVAEQIAQLLMSEATFDGEQVRPHHLAVLCHQTKDLLGVREELRSRGIPSVLVSSESVLRTQAAHWWLHLLRALEQPHVPGRVRLAALTPFIGWSAAQLDTRGDDGTEEVAREVRSLLGIFHRGGIAGVLDVVRGRGLAQRLLGEVGGERDLTDLEHVASLLQEQVLGGLTGVASLVAWLVKQSAEDKKAPADTRIMRLDSDALAVTLSTIHGSKGLQYPIVFAPFLFENWVRDSKSVLLRRDGQRTLSFNPRDLQDQDARAQVLGEHMRLCYVAMTRAQSQLVLWWAPTPGSRSAGLHRLLFGQAATGDDLAALLAKRAASGPSSEVLKLTQPKQRLGQPAIDSTLRAWCDAGAFSLKKIAHSTGKTVVPALASSAPLGMRTFDGSIVDRAWRRTSYSALTAADPVAPTTSEPEADAVGRDDEEAISLSATPADPLREVPSPMAEFPVGATFGSLAHAVLEHADLQARDLRAELLRVVDDQRIWWPVELDSDALAVALVSVCTTPIGPSAGEARLIDLSPGDRFAEMDFEIPLAGGDQPRANATLRSMAAALRTHLPDGDPLRPYADVLEGEELGDQALLGYLTGSIDLTFRRDGRFFVVDYKTNWLGEPGEPLTLADYTPERLAEAMNHSSYPLQAILYSVVLHRYLRWRLPGYHPEQHLGGVMYLYLRGMAGPDTPHVDGQPCGVFTWRPPVALLDELSNILAGELS
ncbi:UvrD-helicase domain-containing protein [Yimella sp. cx-573]|nr:UvrD-helicase domain-containing protein [Yimella sp. cx-573]